MQLVAMGLVLIAVTACAAEAPPPWAGSKVGRTDAVLKPWTPVEVDGGTIRCWGREYKWGDLPFPAQVVTQGHEVLAGPIRLCAVVDGKVIDWQPASKPEPARLSIATGAAAKIHRVANGGGLTVDGVATVEFDGMIRVDFTLSSPTPVTIDSLALEIPLKPEAASLYHYWPLHDWDNAIVNSGAVPPAGLASDFRPLWWLGNEDGGLCWFAESDQGWHLADPKRAQEVTHSPTATTLVLHLWDKPWAVHDSMKYTLGFQATPVKPPDPDWHRTHIAGSISYDTTTDWLDFQKGHGVNVLCTGADWTPIQNYPLVGNPEKLHWVIDESHKRGTPVIPYFGFEISDAAPEYARYGMDVRVLPFNHRFPINEKVNSSYLRFMRAQTSYAVCYRTHWADFMLEGMAKMKREYHIDGVYLDGTAAPWFCANERHGCGYVADDGTRKPTYPIFAVRDLMKRINTLFAQDGGYVLAHASGCKMMPALSFATCHLEAENVTNMPRRRPLETFSLATFRAEFMSQNWGVPAWLLDDYGAAITTDEFLSISLLHDVVPRPDLTQPGLLKIAPYWRAFDAADGAEWFPYWRNQQYVMTSDPGAIFVSFYRVKPRGLLAVVSNLGDKPIEHAKVTFDLVCLGLPVSGQAVDAISGEAMPIVKGVLELNLQPYRARVITFRP